MSYDRPHGYVLQKMCLYTPLYACFVRVCVHFVLVCSVHCTMYVCTVPLTLSLNS